MRRPWRWRAKCDLFGIIFRGADIVLLDEERARHEAKAVGLSVAGSIAILERGERSHSLFNDNGHRTHAGLD